MTQDTNRPAVSQGAAPALWKCEDFELQVRSLNKPYERYEVFADCGGAKSPATSLVFPFSQDELAKRIRSLQDALHTRAGRQLRPAVAVDVNDGPAAIQDLGIALFRALFKDDVERLYDFHRPKSTDEKMLRIRLCIEPTELVALPWEFLYDGWQKDYLCLDKRTSLVRDPLTPLESSPLVVKLPLHILGMVALPQGVPPLKVAQEQDWLTKALQPLIDNKQVILKWVQGQTWRDLDEKLNEEQWHILHYIGHAGYNDETGAGELYMADEAQQLKSQGAQQLVRMLKSHPDLRLVVLNACESTSIAAALTSQTGLPAALAMQYEISDDIAIEFTRDFYQALAEGQSLDVAVWRARYAINQEFPNSFEWGVPVLYMRPRDGQIFDLDSTRKSANLQQTGEVQEIDIKGLRRLLETFFSDDVTLDTFCMDNYLDIQQEFSEGMRHDVKINLLLNHCRGLASRRQTLLANIRAQVSREEFAEVYQALQKDETA